MQEGRKKECIEEKLKDKEIREAMKGNEDANEVNAMVVKNTFQDKFDF